MFWHEFPKSWNPVYTHTLRMMKGLADRKGTLLFLTNKEDMSELAQEVVDGVHVKRSEYLLRRGNASILAKLVLYLKWVLLFQLREIRRFEIVYVRDLLLSTLVMCKLLGKPLVLEKNDVDEANPHIKRNVFGMLSYRMRFRALDFVDIMVVQTEESRMAHEKMGVSPEKIVVVPNGVDTDLFSYGEKPLDHRIKLLYVAHLDENKALDVTLSVAKEMSDNVRLTIVGDGPRRAEFEDAAKRLGLRNVEFLGVVPHNRLPSMILEHDFGIGEYELGYREFRWYGFFFFPLKILEYLSCGRPVFVNASNTMIRELEKSGAVFRFERMEDVVRTINNLLSDPQGLIEIQRKAREIALRFDWRRAIDLLGQKLESSGFL